MDTVTGSPPVWHASGTMHSTLFLAYRYDRAGKLLDVSNSVVACSAIVERAVKLFGGCTLSSAEGFYKQGGEVVVDWTARLEIVHPTSVRDFAIWAGQQLDQASVLLVEVGPNGHYLEEFVACPVAVQEAAA